MKQAVSVTAEISYLIINPQRMRKGFGTWSVCLSVSLSATRLSATYLAFRLKWKCDYASRGDFFK